MYWNEISPFADAPALTWKFFFPNVTCKSEFAVRCRVVS